MAGGAFVRRRREHPATRSSWRSAGPSGPGRPQKHGPDAPCIVHTLSLCAHAVAAVSDFGNGAGHGLRELGQPHPASNLVPGQQLVAAADAVVAAVVPVRLEFSGKRRSVAAWRVTQRRRVLRLVCSTSAIGLRISGWDSS